MPRFVIVPGRMAWPDIRPEPAARYSSDFLVCASRFLFSLSLHLDSRHAATFPLRPTDSIWLEVPSAHCHRQSDNYGVRGCGTILARVPNISGSRQAESCSILFCFSYSPQSALVERLTFWRRN